MLRIINISKGKSTETRVGITSKFGRASSSKLVFNLGPGDYIDMPRHTFSNMHSSVKDHVAEYVSSGILSVQELNSTHKYVDTGSSLQYDYDYLINTGSDSLILSHALDVAEDMHSAMNFHYGNMGVHNATTAAISGSAPTDEATLLSWVASAQTAYTAHRPDATAHPYIDSENTLSSGAPSTLLQAVSAMQELHRAFSNHITWIVSSVSVDIPGILTY